MKPHRECLEYVLRLSRPATQQMMSIAFIESLMAPGECQPWPEDPNAARVDERMKERERIAVLLERLAARKRQRAESTTGRGMAMELLGSAMALDAAATMIRKGET